MKRLILMHGLPGSGKSTLANEILKNEGPGVILSTDDLFMDRDNKEYLWSRGALNKAHFLNQLKCRAAMEKNIPLIIIDNTNLTWKEISEYTYHNHSQQDKYLIEIREPNTYWKYNVDECAQRNSHAVPKATIKKMLERKQDFKHLQKQIFEYCN